MTSPRPEDLLTPAEVLKQFAEHAAPLVAALPEESRPQPAEIAASLRSAVLEAFRTREACISRLVELDLAAGTPDTEVADLRRGLEAVLVQHGIVRVDVFGEPEHFVVVEGDGDGFEVLRPAYVDASTGRLILAGQLRRVPAADNSRPQGADSGSEGAK